MTRLVVFAMLLFSLLALPALAGDDKQFGGVGLQVVPTITGELVVLQVLQKTSAAQQGMLPGDLIYRVGNFPLLGSDFGKVISEHLWGPVGSRVELHYRRPGVAGERKALLERSAIDPQLTVTPTLQSKPAEKRRAE